MSYRVKEIYYTLQGEGAQTGRPAVFLRFSGCNLWSGREEDRAKAICDFCDTDFVGTNGPRGGEYSVNELVEQVTETWLLGSSEADAKPFVVCTGGEPLLQLDTALIDALREADFEIAVETNGTLPVPAGIDWLCCSPKVGAKMVVEEGEELKIVYPQREFDPATFAHLNFTHFYLQPLDGPDRDANTELAMEYCRRHPQWSLSVQTHKLLGIP